MKKLDCTEGPEARENFERAMTAIFQVLKEKKQQDKPTASARKTKSATETRTGARKHTIANRVTDQRYDVNRPSKPPPPPPPHTSHQSVPDTVPRPPAAATSYSP